MGITNRYGKPRTTSVTAAAPSTDTLAQSFSFGDALLQQEQFQPVYGSLIYLARLGHTPVALQLPQAQLLIAYGSYLATQITGHWYKYRLK